MMPEKAKSERVSSKRNIDREKIEVKRERENKEIS